VLRKSKRPEIETKRGPYVHPPSRESIDPARIAVCAHAIREDFRWRREYIDRQAASLVLVRTTGIAGARESVREAVNSDHGFEFLEGRNVNTRTAIILYLAPLALLVASIGAFLIYVSAIGIMSVSAVLLGLVLTFSLGVVAGGRRIRISRMMRRFHDAH
jgi:hypothetical protein